MISPLFECSRMSVHLSWFSEEYSCHTHDGYIDVSVRNAVFVFVDNDMKSRDTAQGTWKSHVIWWCLDSGHPVASIAGSYLVVSLCWSLCRLSWLIAIRRHTVDDSPDVKRRRRTTTDEPDDAKRSRCFTNMYLSAVRSSLSSLILQMIL